MKAEFWHERWAKGEIGFHQTDVNEHLQAYVGRFGVGRGAHFLVPLSGKSLDMLWLVEQGYRVTGIEISEQAARAFFLESRMEHEIVRKGGIAIYRGLNIEIWCADFFTVTADDFADIDAVYDRAALIALPPEARPDYAGHLEGMIGTGTSMLLITLDYPQEEMDGPPFSVDEAEVRGLFGPDFTIDHLRAQELLSMEPRFRKKGLTRMEEHIYMLRKAS